MPIALVTGGASGLGLSVATRLASENNRVVILDIKSEEGNHAVQKLASRGHAVTFKKVDVTDKDQINATVDEIYQQFGSIDFLVNAAGIINRVNAIDVTEEHLEDIMTVNVNGTIYACQAVFKYMSRQKKGSIVNFRSMLSHYGSKNLLPYAASKGAIAQVTKSLAVDWAEHHIRVNAVSPGYIETNLSHGATKDPDFKERILSRTPQGRFGKPEEVAAVVSFCLSDHASFVTGADIPIDGGILAGDPSLYPPA
ncbi:SDR family oxidoreductase [Salicibibacter cibi]|uniref:SDR family oxidoreductase n=2 Tax=Salicibibacter cibi TaxID=2743001 RepID=A0A7T6ZEI0_9BACI|nr:SDR family oxidoreductase [Salicibibacter cibi]